MEDSEVDKDKLYPGIFTATPWEDSSNNSRSCRVEEWDDPHTGATSGVTNIIVILDNFQNRLKLSLP